MRALAAQIGATLEAVLDYPDLLQPLLSPVRAFLEKG
jgi:hypothetical protein